MDRLRSSMAKPGGARVLGVLVALAGVALLAVGVVALDGGSDSGAAPAPPSATLTPGSPASSASPAPSASSSARPSTTTPRPTTATPVPPTATRTTAARAPVTVLNNSTIGGLADRVSRQLETRGWQIAYVGNFAGRLPATTVYYTPGVAGQEAAARQLAAEFPQVEQVLPRYDGLPPTPPGLVLVLTREWS